MTDKQRRGLGRGLGALIPSAPEADESSETEQAAPASRPVDLFFPESKEKKSRSRPVSRETSAAQDLVDVPGARFAQIKLDDIHPNRKQPRSVFDEDDMAELVHSVREIGVLQPIVVRKSSEKGGPSYELVMGERRWRASQLAETGTVPAIIRDTADDDLLRDALLENLHRSQLNPLEEAAAYQQLLEDFGTTHEELADRIGRSRPQVSNTLRLLKLPPLVNGGLLPGYCRPVMLGPFCRYQIPKLLSGWRNGLSLRGFRFVRRRRLWRYTRSHRALVGQLLSGTVLGMNGWIFWPVHWQIGSIPASRSPLVPKRARSVLSSPRSKT